MLCNRLVASSSAQVWWMRCAAAGAANSWLEAVKSDLKLVAAHCDKLDLCVHCTLHEWVCLAKSDGRMFRRLCVSSMHKDENNLKAAWEETRAKHQLGDCFKCHCGKMLCSKQALSIHAFNMHGKQRDSTWKIDSLHCTWCLQFFGTREQMICHVIEKSRCCRMTFSAAEESGKRECNSLHRQGLRRQAVQELCNCSCRSTATHCRAVRHRPQAKTAWSARLASVV
jgi:hypothetical protein